MAKPVPVTDNEFETRVLQADHPVVVDFWAPWCSPCRAIAPILDELAGEYDGQITIAKVNTDQHSEYAGKFGVMAIPTMIIFKDGAEFARIVGLRSKAALKTEFDAALKPKASASALV